MLTTEASRPQASLNTQAKRPAAAAQAPAKAPAMAQDQWKAQGPKALAAKPAEDKAVKILTTALQVGLLGGVAGFALMAVPGLATSTVGYVAVQGLLGVSALALGGVLLSPVVATAIGIGRMIAGQNK